MTTDPAYVAEQTGQVIAAFMTTDPLEPRIAEARAATLTDAMGALVFFEGVVRDHDGGQRVRTLTYTAHPSADEVIGAVTHAVVDKHPDVRLWTAHRTGPLRIGDTAFVVLAAASELADRVKAEVPIWKEQELTDGSSQWVGLE